MVIKIQMPPHSLAMKKLVKFNISFLINYFFDDNFPKYRFGS